MGIYKEFLIFIIGFIVIIKSADLFTSAAEVIALFFKIPRVVIGMTIVSIATTMPEFTVSALSSFMGKGSLAVGNATGSCLANIGLILATAAVIGAVSFEKKIIKQELTFLIAVSCGLLLLAKDGILSFSDGMLLVAILVGFYIFIINREMGARKKNDRQKRQPGTNINKNAVKFLIGAGGVVLAAKYAIIPSGINIARFLGIPEIVIGISMIAVGTSLPELVTAVIASRKKMGDLAVGNVIGANILNILWVLGVSAMINPLQIDAQTKVVTMPLVIVFAALIFIFTRKDFSLTKKEGLGLLFLYTSYIIYIVKFAY